MLGPLFDRLDDDVALAEWECDTPDLAAAVFYLERCQEHVERLLAIVRTAADAR